MSLSGFGQVVISEFCPSNKNILFDEFGKSSDWIELHNTGTAQVSLTGYSLSDDSTEVSKWSLPDINLEAGEFLIIYASGKNQTTGELHTNFSLRGGEEPLLLFYQNSIIQTLDPACVPSDKSYGLQNSANGNLVIFNQPTPGSVNNGTDIHYPDLTPATLSFSHPAGFYEEEFFLTLHSDAGIKYTLDGDEPEENEEWFNDHIIIRNRLTDKEKYADEVTSPEWKKPEGEINKGTVVRAVAWRDGCPVSPLITKTYFVGLDYGMPVISITAERDALFDEDEGIYVPGNGEKENYNLKGDEWEREGHFEYFVDNEQVVASGIGMRIHGRDSRNRPQKSLRIYAKEKYGSDSLYYPFFPGKNISAYKRLLIRTTWNHRTSSLFKDELAHRLVDDMEVGIMDFQPVILFINGEYWGIHNLRERQDKHYLSNNYQVDPENLDMLGLSLEGDEEIEGDEVAFNNLMNYVQNHDLSVNAHYEYVESHVDIQSFIDYHIAYIYFSNYDWPRNNIRFWRERTPGSKWRWLFFDCDVCFRITDFDFMTNYITGSEKYDEYTVLIRALLKNKEFHNRFISSFFHRLNTNFSPDSVLSLIDKTAALFGPEVPQHIRRWHFPENTQSWRFNVDKMKSFAMQRPIEVMNQLSELFGPQVLVYPNPATTITTVDISGSTSNDVMFSVYDVSGRLVKEGNLTSGTQIEVSGWDGGIYFIIVESGQFRFNSRFVVTH